MKSDEEMLFVEHLRHLSKQMEEMVTFLREFEDVQFVKKRLFREKKVRLNNLYSTVPEDMRKIIDKNKVTETLGEMNENWEIYMQTVKEIRKHTELMDNVARLLQKDGVKIADLFKESEELKSELQTRDLQLKDKDARIDSLVQQIENGPTIMIQQPAGPSPNYKYSLQPASPPPLPESLSLHDSLEEDTNQKVKNKTKKLTTAMKVESREINGKKTTVDPKRLKTVINTSMSKERNKKTPTTTCQRRFKKKCYFCDKELRTSNRHLIIHTTEKPFSCSFKNCKYRSCTACNLSKHVEHVHGKSAKFKCLKCSKIFYKKTDFNRHNLVVHLRRGIVKCSDCCSTFMTKYQQLLHYVHVHKQTKPYKCPECQIEFYDGTLKLHLKAKHNKTNVSLSDYRNYVTRKGKIVML